MGSAVVYFEVGAADEAALKRFYAELFDWQIEPFGGNYSSINTRAGSGINGGIGRSSDGTPWASFYVEVDDPQAVLDKAASLGGKTEPLRLAGGWCRAVPDGRHRRWARHSGRHRSWWRLEVGDCLRARC
jgi:predicted enzyme related to lactoylglutathione lyase